MKCSSQINKTGQYNKWFLKSLHVIVFISPISLFFLTDDFFRNNLGFFKDFLHTYATISSILAGFTITASSNFISHCNSVLIEILKKYNRLHEITNSLFWTATTLTISSIMTMLMIFLISLVPINWILKSLFSLWTSLLIYSLLSFLKAIYIYKKCMTVSAELEQQ